MNLLTLIHIELQKIRRSKISLLLLLPVIIMWIPAVFNSSMNFQMQAERISPEHNFLIQGFMGMAWFMLPATLVICTVLLHQTERANRGILKMLSLPVSIPCLCFAKFLVLLMLLTVQLIITIGAYFISAFAASQMQHYDFLLDPLYVCRVAATIYLAAIPMAAVIWMITVLIRTPIFSMGLGLASLVPSVLMINTKVWFAYPMCYPFYVLMLEYGKASPEIFTAKVSLIPWLPTAAVITVICLLISCFRFGSSNRSEV